MKREEVERLLGQSDVSGEELERMLGQAGLDIREVSLEDVGHLEEALTPHSCWGNQCC